MNGKVARRLRRISRSMVEDKPWTEHHTEPVPSLRHKVSDRTELTPECCRAFYLDLKKRYKKLPSEYKQI